MHVLVKAGLALISLFGVMYLEESYDDELFDTSLDYAVDVQENASSAQTNWWKVYNNLGLAFITSQPIMEPYIDLSRRNEVFYFVIIWVFLGSTASVARLNSHQARPFWVDPEIKALTCDLSFGKPDYYALFCCGMSLTLFLNWNAK